jgi:hypothetical protein
LLDVGKKGTGVILTKTRLAWVPRPFFEKRLPSPFFSPLYYWGGAIDDKIFPRKYVIDYVRVYEQALEK